MADVYTLPQFDLEGAVSQGSRGVVSPKHVVDSKYLSSDDKHCSNGTSANVKPASSWGSVG